MRKLIATLVLFAVLVSCCCLTVSAGENTTYTYTLSSGKTWIKTQDAYLPGNIYLKNKGLSQPADIFIHGDDMYVADAGNARVFIYSIKTGESREIKDDAMVTPCGLFVTAAGDVYVADSGAPAVFVFTAAGERKMTIERPQSKLFSELSDFTPKGVAVTTNGNIYVCSENAYEGLMQFGPDGEFEGYFGANRKYLTAAEVLSDLLLTDKMKQNELMRRPRTIQNLDINEENLIYTVTQTNEYDPETQTHLTKQENCLKEYNLAGVNILSPSTFMQDAWNFVDAAAGPNGTVFALTNTGLVYEYDSNGDLIFSFGGRAVSSERNGLFTYATAIDTDDNGFIYVLDREKAFVEVFYPTDFAMMTHQAIFDLENGNYASGEKSWGAVLSLNGMFYLARMGYGKAMLHQGRYAEAMEQFKLAGDRAYYSDAFWQQRDAWLSNNMIWFVVLLFALMIVAVVLAFLRRGKPRKVESYIKPIPKTPGKRFWHDITYFGYMLRHPVDGYYYLKRGEAGSMLSATVMYLLIFIVYVADTMGRGFIFSFSDGNATGIALMGSAFFLLCGLFVIGNYLVASINEGEGSLKNIYMMLPYALSPYLVITPFVVFASYILTQNEAFILYFAWLVALVWSVALIFVGVREDHAYTFMETLKNILLTLFFIMIALVLMAVMYLLWSQVFAYFRDTVMEVLYRAQY